MTIVHLTTFLQGGAGRVVVDLARAQRRRGHTVTVVASRTAVAGYGHYEALLAELAHAGVPVWLVDSTFHREPAANLRAVALLTRLARTTPVDVIHAHAGVPSLVALLFAGHVRSAVRIVQTMHGWGVSKTAEQAEADLAVMNLVDRVVVPSGHAAADLIARGLDPARVRVIAYGIGPDRLRLEAGDAVFAAELDARRRQGTFVLCCVGTIGARKNQALLVEALAELGPGYDAFTVFVGDGESGELRTRIRRAGLDTRAVVRPYTPAARAFARRAHTLVLPSRQEGQPLAVLEAFADQTLVVASDIPPLTELVADGKTGLLHRADDATSLAATLVRARSLEPARRQAVLDCAAADQAARFTVDRMVRQYLETYQAMTRDRLALPSAG